MSWLDLPTRRENAFGCKLSLSCTIQSDVGHYYTVCIKKKVIWFELVNIDLVINFDDLHVAYQLRWAPQFPIGTFLASLLTRMTEYIFIENGKFKSHFSMFG